MGEAAGKCAALARDVRRNMIAQADRLGGAAAHWGGSLSCVEILCVLYGAVLNCARGAADYARKDKLLFSKGHAAMALYHVMARVGLLDPALLETYQADGSALSELAAADPALGIECSGGSLGLNLSLGTGMALLAKRRAYAYQTCVVVGDGELDEGSVWEAVMAAAQFQLDNLTMVVDANGLQSDGATDAIMSWKALEPRLSAFGWDVRAADGHDCAALCDAFGRPAARGKPRAVIARTVKGKGVSFMENDYAWHDAALTREQLETAKREVGFYDVLRI